MVKWIVALAVPAALIFATFLLVDHLSPLPHHALKRPSSTLVATEAGTPLRAFADARGVWRYPITLDEVSPRYLEALLGYEDRWFHHHPGINPLAILRAAWQNLRAGRVVSGGSTLTMQVARLIDPHPRTLAGKLRQMLRALQLEYHYDKRAILTLYLNLAPFGGTLEGVRAASLGYLGRDAVRLSHAEAALLAVLPQAPSRLRPDRYPERARAARDKVLERLERQGVWDELTVREARQERVFALTPKRPLLAPLLARRLRSEHPEEGLITTTLDGRLQRLIDQRLARIGQRLPPHTSLAVLVVENDNLAVRAYAGSAAFLDATRFGHVDMVRAPRSPGSTLKPFLYGFALDDGRVHAESLLSDAPLSFGGYRPGNFSGGFMGAVSVSEALQHSLNVPAVDLLERMGPANFEARLRHGGLDLALPAGAKPNLSLILGGAATSLEALVGAYTALARGGLAGRPRYRPGDPIEERHLLSPGAAWIIRDILRGRMRPRLPHGVLAMAPHRRVAWKTGTSYGYRDAWAIGVGEHYTVGVWVGRPDGTPSPGHYGAVTAAPLLFDLVDTLPYRPAAQGRGDAPPENVERRTICWPLGTPPDPHHPELCHQRREGWILDATIPPTLGERLGGPSRTALLRYWINPENGQRLSTGCTTNTRQKRLIARWPLALQPWLDDETRASTTPPAIDPDCGGPRQRVGRQLKIRGIEPDTLLRPSRADGAAPRVTLRAAGGDGRHYWMVNGELIQEADAESPFTHRFEEPGTYQLTLLDEHGAFDTLLLRVEAAR